MLGTTATIATKDKDTNTLPSEKNIETNTKESKKSKKPKKSKKSKKSDKKVEDEEDEEDEEPKKEELGPHTCTGAITIGGINLSRIDLKWWRSQIGLVQQEPFLFNDTLFNNVAFGLCGTPLDSATKEEKIVMVEEACKEAYADEFIARLPQGYETMVGESGIKLSGGQRQRIVSQIF